LVLHEIEAVLGAERISRRSTEISSPLRTLEYQEKSPGGMAGMGASLQMGGRQTAEGRTEPPGMAGRDGGHDHGGGRSRAADTCPHRRHEGAKLRQTKSAYLATPQTLENPQDREMISQPA